MILITEKIIAYYETYQKWQAETDPIYKTWVFNACFKISESFTDKERIDVRKIMIP